MPAATSAPRPETAPASRSERGDLVRVRLRGSDCVLGARGERQRRVRGERELGADLVRHGDCEGAQLSRPVTYVDDVGRPARLREADDDRALQVELRAVVDRQRDRVAERRPGGLEPECIDAVGRGVVRRSVADEADDVRLARCGLARDLLVLVSVLEQAPERVRLLPDLREEDRAGRIERHEASRRWPVSPSKRCASLGEGAARPARRGPGLRAPPCGRPAGHFRRPAPSSRRRRRPRRAPRRPRPARAARWLRARAPPAAGRGRARSVRSTRRSRQRSSIVDLAAERDRAVRAQRHVAEVHRRRADEPGHERVDRPVVELARALALLQPSVLSTATRCPSVIASAWSCVT